MSGTQRSSWPTDRGASAPEPLPSASASASASAFRRLVLGGCLVPDLPPNWQCPQRHRWRDFDERAWDERLLAVLVAHGYRENDR